LTSSAVNTEHGTIALSEEVIATIAGSAATECYGIVGMVSSKLQDGIATILRRENLGRGVQIERLDDDQLSITLNVVVGYGVKISEVAQNVVDKVRYVVQNTTGLEVQRVKVHVKGVRVGEYR